jgi:hypothetical protein
VACSATAPCGLGGTVENATSGGIESDQNRSFSLRVIWTMRD